MCKGLSLLFWLKNRLTTKKYLLRVRNYNASIERNVYMQQAQVDFVKVSSFVLAMGFAGRALGIVAVSFFLGR